MQATMSWPVNYLQDHLGSLARSPVWSEEQATLKNSLLTSQSGVGSGQKEKHGTAHGMWLLHPLDPVVPLEVITPMQLAEITCLCGSYGARWCSHSQQGGPELSSPWGELLGPVGFAESGLGQECQPQASDVGGGSTAEGWGLHMGLHPP